MIDTGQRIAINLGGGYVPGLNAVITGAVLAASELGWEVVGLRDGFDGLLFPDRYPDGALVNLPADLVRDLSRGAALLGTGARNDPFHVRTINAENQVEELDRSDELLEKIKEQNITAVISVAGSRAISILYKLHRKGLRTVCVPTSVENDVASTMLAFGFNSALSFATEMLDRANQATEAARKIGVVEVLGEHAGWLALQAGMAVCADAILIPEIPYELEKVAATLKNKANGRRGFGLVVVAEGATPANGSIRSNGKGLTQSLRVSLSPGATGPEGAHVIEQSGRASSTIALDLQRLTSYETYPLVLDQLIKGGPATAVDRQLGLGYGAGAVRAIHENQTGVMIAFQPPDLKFVPLAEAINKVRTVPTNSEFVQIARALGIALGD